MDAVKCFAAAAGAAILLALLSPQRAHAHRPVIVKNNSSAEAPVRVSEPEISRAFYGELEGSPHYYRIASDKPFTLYLNILVPDTDPKGPPAAAHDVSFELSEGDRVLFAAEGLAFAWTRFYEPYGRDHYYVGPEFERASAAGVYTVKVWSGRGCRGRYALAVGKTEKFNLFTLVGAMVKAASLDRWFFK